MLNILLFIFIGIICLLFIGIIGNSFREWNIGRDNLLKRHESGLTSLLKGIGWGIIIVIILAIIFY